MHYVSSYIIDDRGQCLWHSRFRIHDQALLSVFQGDQLVASLIETFTMFGVPTGLA